MAIGDQVQRLAARISEARFSWFPCKMTFRGVTFNGASTSIKTGKKLKEGGFFYSHDGIVRIPMARAQPNPPAIGEALVIFFPSMPASGQQVKIKEVLPHPNNPEYRLGVEAV